MIRDPRTSPSATPGYLGFSPHSPYLRRVSPPGSPAGKKCCYDHGGGYAGGGGGQRESFFCCCYTCPTSRSTSLLATLGVCCLVLGYTILGAFTFMTLEGGGSFREAVDTAVAASKAGPDGAAGGPTGAGDVDGLRSDTVDRLWSITENLNILYRENWTRLAAEEVMLFQEKLFESFRAGGERAYATGAGGGTGAAYQRHRHHHKWSFSSSFLYSLTLITTIGECAMNRRFRFGVAVSCS